MSDKKTIVFVLGAGFTRSFIEHAPILKDRFSFTPLLNKFNQKDFPYAHRILRMEEARQLRDDRMDLERLMTRLDGCMPHDYSNRSLTELDLLYRDIKKEFFDKLYMARALQGDTLPASLLKFAAECVTNKISCITFNFDDFLDQALYEARKSFGASTETEISGDSYLNQWNPLDGYGFFCKPADSLVSGGGFGASPSSMLLLKLHGSLNWRLKLGTPLPAPLDTIVHFAKWTYTNPSAGSFKMIKNI